MRATNFILTEDYNETDVQSLLYDIHHVSHSRGCSYKNKTNILINILDTNNVSLNNHYLFCTRYKCKNAKINRLNMELM